APRRAPGAAGAVPAGKAKSKRGRSGPDATEGQERWRKSLPRLAFCGIFFDSDRQKYYHASLMPAQTVIDSLEFARTGQQLGGTLPIAGLTRLADSVFDAGGEIRYELTGLRDARLRPALALVVSGVLRLRCQRCLGELDYRLEIRNVLLLGT